ncbi:hypothetical protein VP01_8292g1 [Puccinia sorghi]|uniref:Reverse transcriptase Ty1/copia-type domain-containing protein n=1 Tax=Puccinia sorghi TaxID=27349 RepID=A0A0L6UBV2_9BASI|nr:hypothetical protein VP01_8292g1 [Puccinia sorghi]
MPKIGRKISKTLTTILKLKVLLNQNNLTHNRLMKKRSILPACSYLKTVWIFKTKPSTLSSAKRKKARLCIQGFLQVPGQYYDDTFAPTGKLTSLLIILLFAIDKKLKLRQFDVRSLRLSCRHCLPPNARKLDSVFKCFFKKFTSLLINLLFAIDKKLDIPKFNVKSTFLSLSIYS